MIDINEFNDVNELQKIIDNLNIKLKHIKVENKKYKYRGNKEYFKEYYEKNKEIITKRYLDFYHLNRKVNFCDLCNKEIINLKVHEKSKKHITKIENIV